MTRNLNRWAGLAAAGMILATSSGCGFSFTPTRTNDGGGGNVLTAGLKVAGGQLGSLTQDEVQTLSDTVRAAVLAVDPNATVAPEMTNEQADGFLDFLTANNLNSLDDVSTFASNAVQDPSIIVVPATLVNAYAGTAIVDSGGAVDAVALLELIFGAM